MSVFVPSGYIDRHVEYPELVTFYLRDPLKQQLSNAFAAAADSLHVYHAGTAQHWHNAHDLDEVKDLVGRFGQGAMVVVAQGTDKDAESYDQTAAALRQAGLIDSPKQFLVVKQGAETRLQHGRHLTQLQI